MTHDLIDRSALCRLRARHQTEDGLFLHHEAIAEIHDRLSSVKKSFADVTIITPFAGPWRAAFPMAQVIADDDTLALKDRSCDLIIHAMALHQHNDPVGQVIQCARALRPDGLFMAIFLGGETLTELRSTLGQAEIAQTGGLSPRVLPMAQLRDSGALLQRAGLALPVADSFTLTLTHSDIFTLMRDLRAMGEGNAQCARLRRPTRRGVFAQAGALYAQHFGDDTGRIRTTIEFHFLTGWTPDPSQPQPLRPGSATARLADALRTTEGKL